MPAQASWIELRAEALRQNIRAFRKIAAAEKTQPRIAVVLKGNAYGHGFEEVLPIVHPECDVIDVITAQDAVSIRGFEQWSGAPKRQVLVLGAVSADEAVELGRAGVDVVIADAEWRAWVPTLRQKLGGTRLRVHVHLDTGLCREGFVPGSLATELAFLVSAPDVFEVVGVLSHFANVEDVTEQEYALSQVRAFEAGRGELEALLGSKAPLERHIAASAAALILPEARLDVMRVGISLYGFWPSSPTRLSARVVLGELPVLEPVLSWRCKSQVVKEIPSGSFVGYGCTYRCPEPTRVAVLPVGYFDGYPRLASGRAHVLVNGQRCPILGRVMMNHLIIDVTRAVKDNSPVVATLIGRDGEESVSAEQLATWADTIHYEIITRLGAHLERRVG